MQKWKVFSRAFLFSMLIFVFGSGVLSPRMSGAKAAPRYGSATSVVISEFRTLGTDEFVEIYNPTTSLIDIGEWKIKKSAACGAYSGTPFTFPTGTGINPGQYILVKGSGYSGSADFSANFSISDTGGIALTNASDIIIDQVGMCGTTEYKEGVFLVALSGTGDKSYERKLGSASDSCEDLNDNSADFQLISPSNPQNSSTPARLCGGNADLILTQTVSNAAPIVGSDVIFTITINNAGTGDARYVQVKDVLPIGIDYKSYSTLSGTYSDATGIWDIGTIANSTSAQLAITGTVVMGGTKTNWAEVWNSYDFDPDSTPGNNSTTEDDDDFATIVPPTAGTADVSIQKIVNNDLPSVGDNVVFSVTVSNAGPDSATNVIVNDDLPAGLDYVSSDGGAAYNSVTGFWQAGQIDPGQSKTLKITANVKSVGAKTNTAEIVSLEQFDATTSDHSEFVTVNPGGGIADLHLEQWTVKSTSTAGYVDLFIKVSNCIISIDPACIPANNYNATNITVMDDLPEGLSFVSYTDSSGGTYDKDSGLWKVGSLDEGESKTLKITVRVNNSSDRVNEAEVWSADQSDPDSTPGNTVDTEDDYASRTIGSADLSITKSMDNVTPVQYQNVVFTIRVSNAGPDAATGVKVKDLLPSNYAYVSDNSGGTYDKDTGIWTVGSLSNGGSATLNITATLVSTSIAVNWAEVWESDQVDIDSVPGNTSRSTDDDASAPSADLRLSMSVSDPYPGLSDSKNSYPFTYTITVYNDGTVGSTNVEIRDKLPSGITYVSCAVDTPAGQTCTYSASTGITWKLPTLATGAANAQSMVITAKLTKSGVVTNWAEVWKSDLPDPDSVPANSSKTEDDDASAAVYHRHILINEVAWAGTSSALLEDQWIELYNPTSVPIDVSGWTLTSSSGGIIIVLDTTIPAGGFFLLERGDDNTVKGDVGSASTQVFDGALLTTGETLYLSNAPDYVGDDADVVDTANIEGIGITKNPWPKGGTSPYYASMERIGNTAESDVVWVTNTGVTKNGATASNGIIYGTPGKKNSTGVLPTPTKVPPTPTKVPPLDRLVINEFLARPGYDWNQDGRADVFDEFIEIKNIGVTNVKLNGWQIDDEEDGGSLPITFGDNITLKPGDRVVYYGLKTNILLSDGGDTVRLLNPKGKVFDTYTYSVVTMEDQSVCRLPDGNGAWYEDCIPTPGLTNTREGVIPSMGDVNYQSPICSLPDTLPADFLYAECRGYGANIWRMYWDLDTLFIPDDKSKWASFVQ